MSKLSKEDIDDAKRDIKAFDKIYISYIKEMYSFAFYLSGTKVNAEDITSESFFKAYRNFKDFKGNENEIRSWLYKIVRNTTYEFFRNKKIIIVDHKVLDEIETIDESDNELLMYYINKTIMNLPTLYGVVA